MGLAIAVEVALLGALAEVNPSDAIGLPGGVAMSIAGTVAVVFGPLDGILVAVCGAIVFGFVGRWEPGELAALAFWPAIAAAAGWFAARVGTQRAALGQVMAGREQDRQRVALELHDESAQTLAAALMTLSSAERGTDPATVATASATARDLIETTVRALRGLAVEMRPKVLDDFGLVAATEQLAARISERSGIHIPVDPGTMNRLSGESEVVLYRIVEESIASAVASGASIVRVAFHRLPGRAAVVVRAEGAEGIRAGLEGRLQPLREQIRLLGGRLALDSTAGVTALRAELPSPISRTELAAG